MNISIDHDSPVPLHAQVEELLRNLIRAPAYQKGKLLQPEEELARQLGISRSTLRAGINRLVYEGLLVRRRGYGTVVTAPEIRTSRLEAWDSFTREMESKGHTVETFLLSVRRTRIPAEARRGLDLPTGNSVVTVERVKGFDGKPVVHFLSYLHPRLGLTGRENYGRPLYELLAECAHVQPERSHETLTAVSADEAMAEALNVPVGAPLLRRERCVTDQGRRPVEFAINHYRCDLFRYTLDIRRGGS
jgi:GntR family transcriptional regulator